MLKRAAALLIPITLSILTFTTLIAATRALAQTQPRGSWLTWVQDYEIYLWDGEHTNRLTDSRIALARNAVWSNDGWLAWINLSTERFSDVMIWDGQSVRNVSQSLHEKRNLLWSPTGQLEWNEGINSTLYLSMWDRTLGIVLNDPSADLDNFASVWSPDGHLARVTRSNIATSTDLMVWDGEAMINVSNTPNADDCYPTWSNDGQLAWIVGCTSGVNGRKSLLVWDGESVTSVDYLPVENFYPLWSSNNRLAWGSVNRYFGLGTIIHDIYVWDGETSVLATGDLGAYQVSWSPDGSRLAFTTFSIAGQYDLYVWDGQTITPITQDAATERDLVWFDNARLIYDVLDLTATRGTSDLFVWDGETTTQLTHTSATEYHLSISPDGRAAWIDSEFYGIYVWDGQSVVSVQNVVRLDDLSWSPIIP